MKFVKENSDKGVHIPNVLIKICGMEENEKLALLPFPKAVLVMPKALTAQELLSLLTSLRLAEQDLVDSLFDACDIDSLEPVYGDDAYLLYAMNRVSRDIGEVFSSLGMKVKEDAEDTANALLDELHERELNMVGLLEHLLNGDKVYE